MSHWRAYATASDVADADLRRTLVAALETLHYVADTLDLCGAVVGGAFIHAVDHAIDELRGDKKEAEASAEEAEGERDEAVERLEKKLQEPAEQELESMRERLAAAEKERDRALDRLGKVEPLLDAYSDHLAMARRFVSASEGAGVKAKHVRPTTAGAKRSGGK